MADTHHHRGQKWVKRRKLDRIYRQYASARRRERWPEDLHTLAMTFTGLPLAAPSHIEPQDWLYVAIGPGIRISHMDQVSYEADDHAPNCVHVFRRNAFIME